MGSARFELLTSYLLHEDDSTTLVVQLSNDSASAGDTTSVTNHVTYDAFGNVTSETSTAASDDTQFHHTGKILDEHTGLQWHQHRWYNPETGRWQSADPIGFTAGDVNLYRYVGNQVVVYIDPQGLQLLQGRQQPGEPAPDQPIGPRIGLPSPIPSEPVVLPEIPGIIANPGGALKGIGQWPIYGGGPSISDVITDPGEAAGGIWQGIWDGMEGGWINNMPDWAISEEATLSYAIGTHHWSVNAHCCGTDNFGMCAEADANLEGNARCAYVVQQTLFEQSGGSYELFGALNAQAEGSIGYALNAQTSQNLSLGGFNPSSDFQCDVSTELSSSLTIGMAMQIGDPNYDPFSAVISGIMSGNANQAGADWQYESGFSFIYQSPIGAGSLRVGAQFTVSGNGDGSSIKTGLNLGVNY